MYDAGKNKKNYYKEQIQPEKHFVGPEWEFQFDEKVLEFGLEKRKNVLPVARETIRMKAMETVTSLKIPRQDFKASNGWVVRFMRRKGLGSSSENYISEKASH
jgi:hypothetical protein